MLSKTIAALVLATTLVGFAGAQAKKASAPTCPVCHMTLSAKKTKMNTVAVKIRGKTYYCCAACKMPKAGKK